MPRQLGDGVVHPFRKRSVDLSQLTIGGARTKTSLSTVNRVVEDVHTLRNGDDGTEVR